MHWSQRAGLGAALVAAIAVLATAPASAQTGYTAVVPQGTNVIIAPTAPPAPQSEAIPPPPTSSPQVTWEAGHWEYRSGNWVWSPGQYVARPSNTAVWQPGQWMQQPDGRYVWQPGHWS